MELRTDIGISKLIWDPNDSAPMTMHYALPTLEKTMVDMQTAHEA